MGIFEWLICSEGREFEQANLQKFKCPGDCPEGVLKLQFDWYLTVSVHWAIPFNIRNPPVEEQWNSSGVRDKSGGILQG